MPCANLKVVGHPIAPHNVAEIPVMPGKAGDVFEMIGENL